MQPTPLNSRQEPIDRSLRRDRAGAIWLIQAFTGILLVPLLLLHMVAHHFVVEGGLREFEQVVAYISNPAIFVISIFFLVVVTIHAALGLRAILVDMRPSPGARRLIDWAFIVAAILTIAYGIWLEVAIAGL